MSNERLSDDYDDSPEARRLRAREKMIEESMPDIDALRAEVSKEEVTLEAGNRPVAVNIKAQKVKVIHSMNGNVVTFNNQEELDILRYKTGLAARPAAQTSPSDARSQFDFDEEDE